MEVRELTFKGESDPKLYACGKCGLAYSPRTYAVRDDMAHEAARQAAEECCEPVFCACGTNLDGPWTACPPCRERNLLTRATVIAQNDYDGPISSEGPGDWSDGFSSSVEAMIEACHDWGEPVPAYCHPCTAHPLRLDPASILENALDGMHEGAEEQVVDEEELIAFINAWNEKQTCVSYYEDRSRVIIVDQARVQEILDRPSKAPEAP